MIIHIEEQWKDGFMNQWGQYVEFFVDPTRSDFLSCRKISKYKDEVRFMCDPIRRKVYIFPSEFLHKDIADFLGVPYKCCLSGIAKKIGNCWEFTRSSLMVDLFNSKNFDAIYNILSYDWSFVNDYINIDNALEIYSDKYKDLIDRRN